MARSISNSASVRRALLGVQARLLGRGQPLLERPLDPGQALQERLLNLTQTLL
jgi:hypothetical protein